MDRLLLLGFLLVLGGIVVVGAGSLGEAGVSTGGFVLIGPVPIVFGTGTSGNLLAVLSLVLGVLMLGLLLFMALRIRGLTREGGEETDK